jgi:hypothetical protein
VPNLTDDIVTRALTQAPEAPRQLDCGWFTHSFGFFLLATLSARVLNHGSPEASVWNA